MVLTHRSFTIKPYLPSKILLETVVPSNFHLFQKSPPCHVPNSPFLRPIRSYSTSAHYPLDQMAPRASFVIHSLNLLKHASGGPNLVTSIHCLSLKTDAISELPVHTSLVTAYARVCDVDSSLSLFDESVAQDVISWNAIINAFVLNCHFRTSLMLFEQMVKEFGEFDSTTLVTVLSAVSRTRNLKHGTILHGTIIKRCFNSDTSLCNALIDMYAKCSDLGSSQLLFERMQNKDTSSWNCMINGSLFNGYAEGSFLYFREMSSSINRADEVSLSCVTSACSSLDSPFDFGESVHGWIIKLGYEGTCTSVPNSLISFYSQCGDVDAAEKVFIGLSEKNVVSWNAMINGLIENGRADEALLYFQKMQLTRAAQPDTLVTIIPVCCELNLLRQGKSLHGYTIRQDLQSLDISVGNSLLGMYLECDDPTSAGHLFRTMPSRDLISWNTMISGYSRTDSFKEESRIMFSELLRTGLRCSLASLLAILPSCTCPEDLIFGKAVHCVKLKCGFSSSVSAVNALMHMYMCCGDLRASLFLLKNFRPVSDVVSWNTIIVGCIQNGYLKDALQAFVFMRSSLLINPDAITFVNSLSACGNLKLLLFGKCMHGLAMKYLMLFNVRVRNALIYMYFQCGDIKHAESVFHMNGDRNVCSWNCMISGFVQNELGDRALETYRHMEDYSPNEISIVGILCACSQLGFFRHGKEINGYVFRLGLQTNAFILTSLIDMYSKCGMLDIAVRVFQHSAEKSIPSWNSMISAYGFHGHGKKAIELFWEMSDLRVKATKSTFIALLSACSHSGLVDEGWRHYNLMAEKFAIKPTSEHYVCMVDMLGRAGRLKEAYEFVKKLSAKPDHGVWGALLSACNDYTDLDTGKFIAKHLFRLEPENTGYYVTLSNLYAYRGMWTDAVRIRSMIQDKGLMKPAALSVIDVLTE